MIYLIETTYYNKNTKEILDLLKIGYTEDSNKDKRFTLYKLHNPGYKLLYEISGYDEDIEKRVQYKFRDLKYNEYGNEWFYYSDDIINFFKNIDNVDLESLPKSPRRREVEFTNLKNEIIDIIKYLFLTKEEYMNYLENLITILGDKFSVSSVLDYIKTDSLINKDLYSKYLEIVKSRESGIYCEDDIVNQEVSEFLRVYTKLSTIHDKLKMLCEYGLSSDAIDIVLGQIADSDEIKSYYTTLGSSKLKSLSYNSAKIKNHLGVVTFSQELLESSIYSEFKVRDKITLSDIKSRLEVLYKSINYDKVAKAKDLENYFEVKNSSIYENGKKVKCYIIIKKKG
nr:MAG: hypothetical protein [Bacteriophage sp.]